MPHQAPTAFVLLLALATLLTAQQPPEPAAPPVRGQLWVRSYHLPEAGRELEYALYVPKCHDASQTLPLVVVLHGLGSNPRQVLGYEGLTAAAEQRGYVLVAPYGYNERGWYGARGKGKEGPLFGTAADPSNLGELSELDVDRVLERTERDLHTDPALRFLMGHSMGGAGTVYLGATRPGAWAGLAPLAPALGGSKELLTGLKTTPTFVATGEADRLVPVQTVRDWVAEMRRLEVPVRYEELTGGDHVRAIARNPALIAKVFDFFDAVRAERAKQTKAAENGAPATSQPKPAAPRETPRNPSPTPSPAGSGSVLW